MKPEDILRYVRKAIRDYAGGDPDKWFLANRHIYRRLQLDERKTSKKVKGELWKSNPVCYYCKEKLKSKRGIHIHRLVDNRGYSLENCVLMHQKCHEQYHRENPDKNRPILKKSSQRYRGKQCKGKYFLYWWDISPGFFKKKYDAIEFVQKDSCLKCHVSTEVLKEYLTDERKTSRGNGNWGVRVLRGREGELAFEPPSGSNEWLFLRVEWR
ncbi:MAG: HNH endonuclease signature motif containing protein [Planctomycetota bacterium]|jgi:hypothetical protein